MEVKSILIDTSAYSSLLKGNKLVQEYLEKVDTIFLCNIVYAELYYGFINGIHFERNLKLLETFLSKPTVITISSDFDSAILFSKIKLELKLKGNPIPINDVWIAAIAKQQNATILTFDKHFDTINEVESIVLK